MFKRLREFVSGYLNNDHDYKSLLRLAAAKPEWVVIQILLGILLDVWLFFKWMLLTWGGRFTLAISAWSGYLISQSMHGSTAALYGTVIVMSFVLRIVFAIAFAVIQFVAIFWFMSRSKVEIITPDDRDKVLTFKDYKGQKELLKVVSQWVYLLKKPEKFHEMGGTLLKGLLLFGGPGTGKTYLAKCAAGEGKVAFISIEGSGFRAMFWGVDVLKMISFCGLGRKLARRYGSCIAYIDEIDAVGASRGGVQGDRQVGMAGGMMGMGAGSGSLTRLLTEMDGMDENFSRWEKFRNKWLKRLGLPIPIRPWHLLFMGSTNRPDVLDSALTRPGRFDTHIVVETPDRAGRREIIQYYIAKVKHQNVDIEAILDDTNHYSPAKIKSAITQDAPRIALSQGRDYITQRDIDQGLVDRALGIPHPIEEFSEAQKKQVAYHEAGHAITFHHLLPEKRMVLASIVRRGSALGFVLPVDKEEVYALPLEQMVKEILVALAGQAGTRVALGEPWTGPTGDYHMVQVRLHGLIQNGYWGVPHGPAETVIGDYKEEIKKLLAESEEKVQKLLIQHRSELDAVANALLEKGTLYHDELVAVIENAQTKSEV